MWTILRFYFWNGRRKRGRETAMCGCLWHAPHWGPGLQPSHVLWLAVWTSDLWVHRLVGAQFTEPHQLGLIVRLLTDLTNFTSSSMWSLLGSACFTLRIFYSDVVFTFIMLKELITLTCSLCFTLLEVNCMTTWHLFFFH